MFEILSELEPRSTCTGLKLPDLDSNLISRPAHLHSTVWQLSEASLIWIISEKFSLTRSDQTVGGYYGNLKSKERQIIKGRKRHKTHTHTHTLITIIKSRGGWAMLQWLCLQPLRPVLINNKCHLQLHNNNNRTEKPLQPPQDLELLVILHPWCTAAAAQRGDGWKTEPLLGQWTQQRRSGSRGERRKLDV